MAYFPGWGPSATPRPLSAALPHPAADWKLTVQGGLPKVGGLILSVDELKLLPVTDCHVPLTLCGPHRACGGLSESHRWPVLTSLDSRVPSFPA